MARNDGIDRTFARNQDLPTLDDVAKVQEHNEREKDSYSNQDIDTTQTYRNIHFKAPTDSYTAMFDQMIADGIISTRGLKADAVKYGELIFDVNSAYFHNHGGYEYAKQFYTDAYKAAVEIVGGEQYILSPPGRALSVPCQSAAKWKPCWQQIEKLSIHFIFIKAEGSYFGTVEKPECDMLYNVTTMCTTWHTVATRDARLLKRQMEQVCALPKTCLFQNYLRCHDDIGWGLDYPWLEQFGITEVAHKKYLNDWFTGKLPGSWSKGELYNDDPRLGDARLCGTTASLTGLEKAAETEDNALMDQSMLCFWMLHAWMFSQSGIPVLYSGDEVAQFNDNDYKADPDKMDDSRYLHRGNFDWEKAALRTDISTVQGKAFSFLRKLETIRAEHPAFRSDAKVTVLDIGCDSVLGISRKYNGEELLLLFNFSEKPVTCNLGEGQVLNLIFGGAEDLSNIDLTGYGFRWLAC